MDFCDPGFHLSSWPLPAPLTGVTEGETGSSEHTWWHCEQLGNCMQLVESMSLSSMELEHLESRSHLLLLLSESLDSDRQLIFTKKGIQCTVTVQMHSSL